MNHNMIAILRNYRRMWKAQSSAILNFVSVVNILYFEFTRNRAFDINSSKSDSSYALTLNSCSMSTVLISISD